MCFWVINIKRAKQSVYIASVTVPAHSRLSKDNWKLFFLRTHFLSFSFILIVYRVLEAFSLNATLIFTSIIIMFSDGGSIAGQRDTWARFAVITYDHNNRRFVYSARRWDSGGTYRTLSYICQLQQGPLTPLWRYLVQFYMIYVILLFHLITMSSNSANGKSW